MFIEEALGEVLLSGAFVMPQIYNLPGTSNNIDIKGIIDKLVKVESKRIDTYKIEKDHLNKKKSALVELNNKLKSLDEAAKNLYGFRSPFEDKVAVSSDEDVLTATAARVAVPSEINIKVLQLAQNERIVSDPVPDDKILKSLPIHINVGKKDVEIDFEGGTISELADSINKQAKDYLIAKIAKNTENSSVLILETKNTGEKYRLSVNDNSSLELFKKIGLFYERKGFSIQTGFTADKFTPITPGNRHVVKDGVLLLNPGSKVYYNFDESIPIKDSIYVSVKIRVKDLALKEQKVFEWPELSGIGKVKIKDIEIEGGKPLSTIKEKEVKESQKPVIDNGVLAVDLDGKLQKKIIPDLSEEFKEYKFKITDLIQSRPSIDKIVFLNDNTNREVEIKDLKVIDTEAGGGISPKHIVQQPKNSIIDVDGIRVERDSNEIKDVIKGVTLDLKNTSKDPIHLQVDRDYEKITKKIVELIEKYNDVLKYINENTKISATGRLTEKNKAGIFSGDMTVSGIKTKLQLIMMNPYPTDRGKNLNLLAQIGISMGKTGSSWNEIKGGYLQVDEDKFIDAFKRFPDEIKQLFGSDTNNDMVIDNGVAYSLDKTLKGYTHPQTGIITYRIKNTDNEIKDQDKKIDDWNQHLDDYRKELERKFTVMQEALHELDSNKRSIENFNKQLGGK